MPEWSTEDITLIETLKIQTSHKISFVALSNVNYIIYNFHKNGPVFIWLPFSQYLYIES